MILVSPQVELIDDSDYIRTMVFAGRLTHGSQNKFISREDDLEYIERMKKHGHGRVFEFGTIYLTITKNSLLTAHELNTLLTNRYTMYRVVRPPREAPTYYITTNYRVLLQGGSETWEDAINSNYKNNLLRLLDEDTIKKGRTENHIMRPMVLWKNISRVTADSFRTHTMLSSLMQSTRYCNYGSARFGNDVRIARSVMWQEEDGTEDVQYNAADILNLNVTPEYRNYLYRVCTSCATYIDLTTGHYGTKVAAECARGLLPLDTATYFLQCGFTREWKDFFRQRLDAGAHPDAIHITQALVKEFTQNRITDLAN